jgi:putative transposase
MARLPRLDLPGIPQHLVQRGNNRLPCFLDDLDRRRYLTLLRDALLDSECALHAYVLMDNHIHLLVTPPRTGAVARMMPSGWLGDVPSPRSGIGVVGADDGNRTATNCSPTSKCFTTGNVNISRSDTVRR